MSKEPAPATSEDLQASVSYLETRLMLHPDETVHEAWEVYQSLVPRFEASYGAAPRDLLLAKAGALLLVQGVARQRTGY